MTRALRRRGGRDAMRRARRRRRRPTPTRAGPRSEQGQAGRRGPEGAGDQDAHRPAGLRFRRGGRQPRGRPVSPRGPRHPARRRCRRHGHAVPAGHILDSRVQLVRPRPRRGSAGAQARKGIAGAPAHGRDVGDVDRDRLSADVPEGGGGPVGNARPRAACRWSGGACPHQPIAAASSPMPTGTLRARRRQTLGADARSGPRSPSAASVVQGLLRAGQGLSPALAEAGSFRRPRPSAS